MLPTLQVLGREISERRLGDLGSRLLLVEINEECAGKGEGIPFSPSLASFVGSSFCVLYLPWTGTKPLVNLVEFTLIRAPGSVNR